MNDSSEANESQDRSGASLARLADLFKTAIDLAPEDRDAWIAANVAGRGEHAALMRLLVADQDPGFLDTPVSEHATRITEDGRMAERLVGQRIGAFRLMRLLGKGGMAAVFLGSREGGDFRQDVAIKLLRRGLYSEVEQRLFLRERQVLASLSHPNIARLFDGGVTDAGIPYLVMEYVDGRTITQHSDERKLDVAARLELFQTVCHAVDAAHRALIVHRDIKPSNVLVSSDGAVKLLDFGIAKLLEDNVESGTVGVFTPDYAAPEQIAGRHVTTATDVYALGVVLHELILGVRPRHPAKRPSSIDARQGAAAGSPAQLKKILRGDLDNILMKALAPEPDRRYVSAGALADDIQRYLGAQPVLAHPPSPWYRARKFVRRHRLGVASTLVFAIAVVAALATALWQANVARVETQRADSVRDFLMSVFNSAGADLPKDQRPSTEDLVDRAAARLMSQDALPDPLRADLLMTLAKVAESVGAFDRAVTLLDRGEPIIARLYGPDDARSWDAKVTRAELLLDRTHYAEAAASLQPMRERLASRRDAIGVRGMMVIGAGLSHAGRVDEGLAALRRARELGESEDTRLADLLLRASIQEAATLLDAQHFREGLDRSDATLALWHRLGDPPNRSIVDLYVDIAVGAEALGDVARAEVAYKQAIDLGDRYFDKPNPSTAWNVGIYGTFLVAQGRFDEAEPYLKRGLEMRRAVLGDEDQRTLYAIGGMGKLRTGQHNYRDAEAWFTQGIDICRKAALRAVVCPRLLAQRGRAFGAEGRFREGENDIRNALAQQREFGGDNNPPVAYILDYLVILQVAQHHYEEAIATADEVLAIYKGVNGGMLQSELGTRFERATALFELHKNDDALREVLDIEPKYAALVPGGALRFDMLALKARALARARRAGEAHDAAQSALALDHGTQTVDQPVIEELQTLATVH